MTSPLSALEPLVSAAIAEAFGPEFHNADPVLRPSQFGDIQVNASLALAKRLEASGTDWLAWIPEREICPGGSN